MNNLRMYQLLGRARKGLNLIIVGTYTMKASGLCAPAAAFLIILIRWLGWPGANFLGWLFLTGCGCLAGLAIGLGYKRWDEAAVARWLDARFGFQDAITAALICIRRGCSGPLDQGIVERAQLVSADCLPIKWPLSRFYRQTIQAALLIGVSVLALTLIPSRLKFHSPTAKVSSQITDNSESQLESRPTQPEMAPLTPGEIAKMLFSHHPQLMIQAEKAVMAGDMESLRSLLRKAMKNPEPEYLDRTFTASRQNLFKDLQDGQLIQNLISAESMEDFRQIVVQNQVQQSQHPETKGQDRDQPARELAQRQSKSKPGSGKTPQNNGNHLENQRPEPDQLRGLGTYAYNSALPGQEKGTQKGFTTRIIPQTGSSKKPVILVNKGGFFEYLLPGKDAQVPLAGVLPEAAQASEQALFTRRAPAEYADFTRSYFLKLSQSIAGSPPESEGKP
ncbi:MAG: hypothetical protein K6U80_10540 [Firmicutes bacterium]|nr:hypothetical protein [Bacillota bacterium]